jgi:F-type H+-transporting ATPase subunit b
MLPLSGGVDLGPLLPEYWSEIIVGAVLFGIIYWVMKTKVVPMFEATYSERTAKIEGGIQKADEAQREAAKALEEYREQLASAREEAGRIREDAKTQGSLVVSEMRQQAQEESSRLLANAKTQIEAERGLVFNQLRSEVGGLATTLAGRIVGESLDDDERARRSVDRFLAELEQQSPAEKA